MSWREKNGEVIAGDLYPQFLTMVAFRKIILTRLEIFFPRILKRIPMQSFSADSPVIPQY